MSKQRPKKSLLSQFLAVTLVTSMVLTMPGAGGWANTTQLGLNNNNSTNGSLPPGAQYGSGTPSTNQSSLLPASTAKNTNGTNSNWATAQMMINAVASLSNIAGQPGSVGWLNNSGAWNHTVTTLDQQAPSVAVAQPPSVTIYDANGNPQQVTLQSWNDWIKSYQNNAAQAAMQEVEYGAATYQNKITNDFLTKIATEDDSLQAGIQDDSLQLLTSDLSQGGGPQASIDQAVLIAADRRKVITQQIYAANNVKVQAEAQQYAWNYFLNEGGVPVPDHTDQSIGLNTMVDQLVKGGNGKLGYIELQSNLKKAATCRPDSANLSAFCATATPAKQREWTNDLTAANFKLCGPGTFSPGTIVAAAFSSANKNGACMGSPADSHDLTAQAYIQRRDNAYQQYGVAKQDLTDLQTNYFQLWQKNSWYGTFSTAFGYTLDPTQKALGKNASPTPKKYADVLQTLEDLYTGKSDQQKQASPSSPATPSKSSPPCPACHNNSKGNGAIAAELVQMDPASMNMALSHTSFDASAIQSHDMAHKSQSEQMSFLIKQHLDTMNQVNRMVYSAAMDAKIQASQNLEQIKMKPYTNYKDGSSAWQHTFDALNELAKANQLKQDFQKRLGQVKSMIADMNNYSGAIALCQGGFTASCDAANTLQQNLTQDAALLRCNFDAACVPGMVQRINAPIASGDFNPDAIQSALQSSNYQCLNNIAACNPMGNLATAIFNPVANPDHIYAQNLSDFVRAGALDYVYSGQAIDAYGRSAAMDSQMPAGAMGPMAPAGYDWGPYQLNQLIGQIKSQNADELQYANQLNNAIGASNISIPPPPQWPDWAGQVQNQMLTDPTNYGNYVAGAGGVLLGTAVAVPITAPVTVPAGVIVAGGGIMMSMFHSGYDSGNYLGGLESGASSALSGFLIATPFMDPAALTGALATSLKGITAIDRAGEIIDVATTAAADAWKTVTSVPILGPTIGFVGDVGSLVTFPGYAVGQLSVPLIPYSLALYGGATVSDGSLTFKGMLGALTAPANALIGSGAYFYGTLMGDDEARAVGIQGIAGNALASALGINPATLAASNDPAAYAASLNASGNSFLQSGQGLSPALQALRDQAMSSGNALAVAGAFVLNANTITADVSAFGVAGEYANGIAKAAIGPGAVAETVGQLAMGVPMLEFYGGQISNLSGALKSGNYSVFAYEMGSMALGVAGVKGPDLSGTDFAGTTLSEAGKIIGIALGGQVLPVVNVPLIGPTNLASLGGMLAPIAVGGISGAYQLNTAQRINDITMNSQGIMTGAVDPQAPSFQAMVNSVSNQMQRSYDANGNLESVTIRGQQVDPNNLVVQAALGNDISGYTPEARRSAFSDLDARLAANAQNSTPEMQQQLATGRGVPLEQINLEQTAERQALVNQMSLLAEGGRAPSPAEIQSAIDNQLQTMTQRPPQIPVPEVISADDAIKLAAAAQAQLFVQPNISTERLTQFYDLQQRMTSNLENGTTEGQQQLAAELNVPVEVVQAAERQALLNQMNSLVKGGEVLSPDALQAEIKSQTQALAQSTPSGGVAVPVSVAESAAESALSPEGLPGTSKGSPQSGNDVLTAVSAGATAAAGELLDPLGLVAKTEAKLNGNQPATETLTPSEAQSRAAAAQSQLFAQLNVSTERLTQFSDIQQRLNTNLSDSTPVREQELANQQGVPVEQIQNWHAAERDVLLQQMNNIVAGKAALDGTTLENAIRSQAQSISQPQVAAPAGQTIFSIEEAQKEAAVAKAQFNANLNLSATAKLDIFNSLNQRLATNLNDSTPQRQQELAAQQGVSVTQIEDWHAAERQVLTQEINNVLTGKPPSTDFELEAQIRQASTQRSQIRQSDAYTTLQDRLTTNINDSTPERQQELAAQQGVPVEQIKNWHTAEQQVVSDLMNNLLAGAPIITDSMLDAQIRTTADQLAKSGDSRTAVIDQSASFDELRQQLDTVGVELGKQVTMEAVGQQIVDARIQGNFASAKEAIQQLLDLSSQYGPSKADTSAAIAAMEAAAQLPQGTMSLDEAKQKVEEIKTYIRQQLKDFDFTDEQINGSINRFETTGQQDAIVKALQGKNLGIQASVGMGKTLVAVGIILGRAIANGESVNVDLVLKSTGEIDKYLGRNGGTFMKTGPSDDAPGIKFIDLLKSKNIATHDMNKISSELRDATTPEAKKAALAEFENAMSDRSGVRIWTSEALGHLQTYSQDPEVSSRIGKALEHAGQDANRVVIADEGDILLSDTVQYVQAKGSTPIGTAGLKYTDMVQTVIEKIGFSAKDGKYGNGDFSISRAESLSDYQSMRAEEKAAYYRAGDGTILMTNTARTIFDKADLMEAGQAERIISGIETRKDYAHANNDQGERVIAPISKTEGKIQIDRVLQDPLLSTAITMSLADQTNNWKGDSAEQAIQAVHESKTNLSSSGGRLFVGKSQVVLMSGSLDTVASAADAFGVKVETFGSSKNVFQGDSNSSYNVLDRLGLVASPEVIAQATAMQIVDGAKDSTGNLMRKVFISEDADIRQRVETLLKTTYADRLAELGITTNDIVRYDEKTQSSEGLQGDALKNSEENRAIENAKIVIGSMSRAGRGVDYQGNIDLYVDATGMRQSDLVQALGRVDRRTGQEYSRTVFAVEADIQSAVSDAYQAGMQQGLVAAGAARGGVPTDVDTRDSGLTLMGNKNQADLTPAELLRVASWSREMGASSEGMQSNTMNLIKDMYLEKPLTEMLRDYPEGSKERALLQQNLSSLQNNEFFVSRAMENIDGVRDGAARMKEAMTNQQQVSLRALNDLLSKAKAENASSDFIDKVTTLRDDWKNPDLNKIQGEKGSVAQADSLEGAIKAALGHADELSPALDGTRSNAQTVLLSSRINSSMDALQKGQLLSEDASYLSKLASNAIASDPRFGRSNPTWALLASAPDAQSVANTLAAVAGKSAPAALPVGFLPSLSQRIGDFALTAGTLWRQSNGASFIPRAIYVTGKSFQMILGGSSLSVPEKISLASQGYMSAPSERLQNVAFDNLYRWALQEPQAVANTITQTNIQNWIKNSSPVPGKSVAGTPAVQPTGDALNNIRQIAINAPTGAVESGHGFLVVKTMVNEKTVYSLYVDPENKGTITSEAIFKAASLSDFSKASGIEVNIQLPKAAGSTYKQRAEAILNIAVTANTESGTATPVEASALRNGGKAAVFVAEPGDMARRIPPQHESDGTLPFEAKGQATLNSHPMPPTPAGTSLRTMAAKVSKVYAGSKSGPILDIENGIEAAATLKRLESVPESGIPEELKSQIDEVRQNAFNQIHRLLEVAPQIFRVLPALHLPSETKVYVETLLTKLNEAAKTNNVKAAQAAIVEYQKNLVDPHFQAAAAKLEVPHDANAVPVEQAKISPVHVLYDLIVPKITEIPGGKTILPQIDPRNMRQDQAFMKALPRDKKGNITAAPLDVYLSYLQHVLSQPKAASTLGEEGTKVFVQTVKDAQGQLKSQIKANAEEFVAKNMPAEAPAHTALVRASGLHLVTPNEAAQETTEAPPTKPQHVILTIPQGTDDETVSVIRETAKGKTGLTVMTAKEHEEFQASVKELRQAALENAVNQVPAFLRAKPREAFVTGSQLIAPIGILASAFVPMLNLPKLVSGGLTAFLNGIPYLGHLKLGGKASKITPPKSKSFVIKGGVRGAALLGATAAGLVLFHVPLLSLAAIGVLAKANAVITLADMAVGAYRHWQASSLIEPQFAPVAQTPVTGASPMEKVTSINEMIPAAAELPAAKQPSFIDRNMRRIANVGSVTVILGMLGTALAKSLVGATPELASGITPAISWVSEGIVSMVSYLPVLLPVLAVTVLGWHFVSKMNLRPEIGPRVQPLSQILENA
jgi:hypothetical protein